jgi:vacuolar-type H+-ATPase subunit H
MARVRDILYRFRPAGSPGAAGTAGVPVDRGADLAAELGPLFAQLADTETACDALVETARSEAVARHGRAIDAAHALIERARDEAVVERAASAAATQSAGETQLASILAHAEAEAEEVRRRAAARLPDHVARVVAFVRTVSDLPSGQGRGAA